MNKLKIKEYHNHKSISNKDLLELYGLYKQGKDGDINISNNFRTFKEKKCGRVGIVIKVNPKKNVNIYL